MNLQLLNHIKSCESKKARSFIDGIVAQHNNAYGKALVRVMLHDAAEELNKAIPAFYTDISELDDLLFSENEENGLYKAIFSLCSTMHQAKIKDEEMLYHKAESIIQKSYSNQMLSAALVSKALEISLISRITTCSPTMCLLCTRTTLSLRRTAAITTAPICA